ncbi:MAG: hypothetical protein IKM59_07110, partial [Oscillospiraceae bacterium]|nr:hypothetical protein [Oscillospiraceae bacterium]
WTEEDIQAKKVTAIQNILVDTYLDLDEGKTLYQIPVIKYEVKDSSGNPKHGTYTVYFRAYYHEMFDHNYVPPTTTESLTDVPSFRRGERITDSEICELLGWDPSVPMSITLGEFQDARPATRADVVNSYDVYVDGIRVYNTLGTLSAPSGNGNILSTTSNAATYAAHAVYNCGNIYHSKGVITEFVGKEVNPYFFNVSDLLVDSGNTNWSATLNSTNSVNGILYIAASVPDGYVDDNGGQSGNNSNNADGLIHSGFHLGMSGALYTEEVDGKFYIYRMKTVTNADGSVTVTNEKERAKHNGQDVYYRIENGKNVYYAGNSKITDVELFAACGQTVCYYSAKYDAIGPENEIYLKKNNGIAMEVTTGTKVDIVHVGLRSLDGYAITVTAWNGSQWVSVATGLKTRTETYFDVTSAVNGAKGKLYLKVTNGTASVVNIKVVGGSKPSVSTRMIMDAIEVFKTGGEPPLLDEGLKIHHSLNLADDISMNYAVAVSVLEGAEVSYMTVELPKYEGNDLVGTEIVTVDPVRNGNYYYYTLRGLTAVNMNDVLKAELRYFKDGRDYVSATDEYSIARYAYTQLDGTTAPESLKVLCANLLRYGGEAQIYKSYRTDAIVSDEMTDAHCSYLTDLDRVVFGNLNTVSSDLEAPTVLWAGKALNLESRISLVFVVDASGFAGDLSDLSLRVTYVNGDGKTVTREITTYEPYGIKEDYIAYTFSDLLAAELRTPLDVAVYAGEEQVSPTLCYSADTYGNGKPGQLGILCRALFAYADAAEAFFGK